MIADIRKHLEIVPFVPFAVRTADGREYPVPTVDHVYLPPGGSRVVIANDEGVTVALPALLISGLVQGSTNGRSKHEG
jgi:hypothetical protein